MTWLYYLVVVLHLDHGVHCKGMFGCGVSPNRAVVLPTPSRVALRIPVVLARPTRFGLAAFLMAAHAQAFLFGIGGFYEVHVIHVFT